MNRLVLALSLGLTACAGGAGSETPTQPAHTERLAYEVPVEWSQTDARVLRGTSSTWTPTENARKESLVVSRVTVQPGRPAPTVDSVRALLVAAQRELPHAEISNAQTFVTPTGLRGVRVETEFVPPGATGKYHRVLRANIVSV